MKINKKLVYLGSAYTHSSEKVMEQRFNSVCKTAGILFNKGLHVFCPIAMSHPIKVNSTLNGDWKTWADFDERMLGLCTDFWVICSEGWKTSVGLTAEIKYALKNKIPITFIDEFGQKMK